MAAIGDSEVDDYFVDNQPRLLSNHMRNLYMDWSIYKVSPYAISPSRFTNGLNSSIDYNSAALVPK